MSPSELSDEDLMRRIQQGGGISTFVEAVRELTRRYFKAKGDLRVMEAELDAAFRKLWPQSPSKIGANRD